MAKLTQRFRLAVVLIIHLAIFQSLTSFTMVTNKPYYSKAKQGTNIFVDETLPARHILYNAVNSIDVRTLHIFSHGKPGMLFINGSWLGPKELQVFLLDRISKIPSPIVQINLYGCEFAKGRKGRRAVDFLEKSLGVTIAASTNITGKRGDWVLENVQRNNSLDIRTYPINLQVNEETVVRPFNGTNFRLYNATLGWGTPGDLFDNDEETGAATFGITRQNTTQDWGFGYTLDRERWLSGAIINKRNDCCSQRALGGVIQIYHKGILVYTSAVINASGDIVKVRLGNDGVLGDEFRYVVLNGGSVADGGKIMNISDFDVLAYLDIDGDNLIESKDLDDDNDGILDCSESSDTVNALFGWTLNSPQNTRNADNFADPKIQDWVITGTSSLIISNMAATLTGGQIKINVGSIAPNYATASSQGKFFQVSFTLSTAISQISLKNIVSGWYLPADNGDAYYTKTMVYEEGSTSWVPLSGDILHQSNGNSYITSDLMSKTDYYLKPGKTYYFRVYPFSVINDSSKDYIIFDDWRFQVDACKVQDTDFDFTPDHQDIDSDGDSCPDALEGDAPKTRIGNADLDGNYQITGGVDANGVPQKANGGQGIGTSTDVTLQASECGPCDPDNPNFNDNDSDGVGDFCDLDDDNDGILDVDEGAPTQSDGEGMYVICSTGNLFQFNTLSSKWDLVCPSLINISGDIASHPITGEIYGITFTTGSVTVYKLNSSDCSLTSIASSTITQKGSGAGFLPDGRLLIGTNSDSKIYQVNIDTGAISLYATTGYGIIQGDIAYYKGNLIYTAYNNSDGKAHLYSVALDTSLNPTGAIRDVAIVNSGSYGFGVASNGDILGLTYSNIFERIDFTTGQVNITTIPSYGCTGFGATGIYDSGIGCVKDNDSDGICDYQDLDSDGDGCPDALEGNASNSQIGYGNLDVNGQITGGVDVNGVPLAASGGQGIGTSTDANLQAGECSPCSPNHPDYSDKDNDGVGDPCDRDKDNDGILDLMECSSIVHSATVPVTVLDLSNATELADTNSADYIGPQVYKSAAATAPDGTCLDVLITIEQLTTTSTPFFKWTTGAILSHLGGSSRLYELRLEFFECGTTNPVKISAMFNFDDLDGDCDWNNDGVSDNPDCNNYTSNMVNDEFMSVASSALLDFKTNNPTLVYTQDKENRKVFYSSGSNNPYYTGKSGVSPNLATQSFEVLFKVSSSNSFQYYTGQFGGLKLDGGTSIDYCDSDGDGIPDHLDKDSDNDGCPDALEGDATNSQIGYPNLDANTQVIGGVDGNGVPLAASGGQGTGSSADNTQQASECSPCHANNPYYTDNDADGIGDLCDLDDDNDGINDCTESSDSYELKRFGWTMNSPTNTTAMDDWTDTRITDWGLSNTQNMILSGPFSIVNSSIQVSPAQKDLAGAIANNEFVELAFTTGEETVSTILYDIFSVWTKSSPGDSFYTSTLYRELTASSWITMAKDNLHQYNSSANTTTDLMDNTSIDLKPGTTYVFRFYIYGQQDDSSYSFGILDDIYFRSSACRAVDTDNDTTFDYLDWDSDNDGCPDVLEAGFADGDNDQILGTAPISVNTKGQVTGQGGYIQPLDTDANGTMDFQQAASPITIALQPMDATACPGCTTNFSVATTNANRYQWQINNMGIWENLSDNGIYTGTSTNTLQISKVTSTLNAKQYRLVLTNTANVCDTKITDLAILSVRVTSVITNKRITHRVKKN